MKIIKCDICGSDKDVKCLRLPIFRMHDGCDGLTHYDHPEVVFEDIDICPDCLTKCTNICDDTVMGYGNRYLQINPELKPKNIATPSEVKLAVRLHFEKLRLSMADAGVHMGQSRAAVSYVLKMRDKYFTNAQAKRYAKAFNFSIDYLTKGEGSL